jgi:hypothetical protein
MSIGWKLSAAPQGSIDSSDSSQALTKVTGFLARHHFNVLQSGELPGGTQAMRVADQDCTMLVALSSPRGWDRDMIRQLSGPADQSFVVFRGRIYAQQPIVLTVAEFLWSRLLGELGITADPAPVVAVSAPVRCNAEHLPWAELA